MWQISQLFLTVTHNELQTWHQISCQCPGGASLAALRAFQSSESPHTSRSILFLAMAACGMIWPSLVQPHCLLGALSNTRPRHQVPTTGIGPRSGSLGPSPVVPSHLWFFSNGSHVATGFLSATLWLSKASTLPTKCPRPQRQASLWGTSTLLNVGWDVWPGSRHCFVSSAFLASISATAPLEPREARRTWSTAQPAPRRGSCSFTNPACSGAGSLLLPRAEIYMAGDGGAQAHGLEQLDTLRFILHLGW